MTVKVWKILGLLLITFFASSATGMVHATATLGVSFTIPNISGSMAYDSVKGEIFVMDGTGTVSVVSDSSNKVVATVGIPGMYGAVSEIAYDAGKGEIFAATGNSVSQGQPPTVWVISDSTNAIVANITSRSWWTPWGVAYDSGKGEIFLTDSGNNRNVFGGVYIISDSTNTVVGSISAGNYPRGLIYDSGMGEIFVCNYGSSSVSVISDNTNKVVATIDVGSFPSGIAYDASKGEVFVANSGNNTVSVISDKTNTVVATITGLSGNQALGKEGVVYNSGKNEVFAGNVVISDSKNAVVAQLPYSIEEAIYDSAKGEIIAATSKGLDIFSDSSNLTAAPSPSVPEFGSAALILVAAVVIVSFCAVGLARKKSMYSRLS